MKKITIITGKRGSGKSQMAAKMATANHLVTNQHDLLYSLDLIIRDNVKCLIIDQINTIFNSLLRPILDEKFKYRLPFSKVSENYYWPKDIILISSILSEDDFKNYSILVDDELVYPFKTATFINM